METSEVESVRKHILALSGRSEEPIRWHRSAVQKIVALPAGRFKKVWQELKDAITASRINKTQEELASNMLEILLAINGNPDSNYFDLNSAIPMRWNGGVLPDESLLEKVQSRFFDIVTEAVLNDLSVDENGDISMGDAPSTASQAPPTAQVPQAVYSTRSIREWPLNISYGDSTAWIGRFRAHAVLGNVPDSRAAMAEDASLDELIQLVAACLGRGRWNRDECEILGRLAIGTVDHGVAIFNDTEFISSMVSQYESGVGYFHFHVTKDREAPERRVQTAKEKRQLEEEEQQNLVKQTMAMEIARKEDHEEELTENLYEWENVVPLKYLWIDTQGDVRRSRGYDDRPIPKGPKKPTVVSSLEEDLTTASREQQAVIERQIEEAWYLAWAQYWRKYWPFMTLPETPFSDAPDATLLKQFSKPILDHILDLDEVADGTRLAHHEIDMHLSNNGSMKKKAQTQAGSTRPILVDDDDDGDEELSGMDAEDSATAKQNDERDALLDEATGKNSGQFDMDTWKTCCLFVNFDYRCQLPRAGVRIRGIITPLFAYQFYAVYWMLSRHSHHKMTQVFLADVMGFGKTLVMIGQILVNRWLERSFHDVDRFRGILPPRANGPAQNTHLPKGSLETKCPTDTFVAAAGQGYRGGPYINFFECPCVKDSIAASFYDTRSRGGTLVVQPNGLVYNFAEQMAKHVLFERTSKSDTDQEDAKLDLLFCNEPSQASLNQHMWVRAKSTATQTGVDLIASVKSERYGYEDEDKLPTFEYDDDLPHPLMATHNPLRDQSHMVYICPTHRVKSSFIDKLNDCKGQGPAIGTVMVDEFQTARDEDTTFIKVDMANLEFSRIDWISATPFTKSATELLGPLKIFHDSYKALHHGHENAKKGQPARPTIRRESGVILRYADVEDSVLAKVRGMSPAQIATVKKFDPANLKEIGKIHSQLIAWRAKFPKAVIVPGSKEDGWQKAVIEWLKGFAQEFVIRRTPTTEWFGQGAVKMPALRHRNLWVAGTDQIQRWLDNANRDYNDRRWQGEKKSYMGCKAFADKVAVLPYLQELVDNKDLGDWTSASFLKPLAEEIERGGWGHPFMIAHGDSLIDNSPKLCMIKEILQKMREGRDYAGNVEKGIVFANSPFVVVIIDLAIEQWAVNQEDELKEKGRMYEYMTSEPMFVKAGRTIEDDQKLVNRFNEDFVEESLPAPNKSKKESKGKAKGKAKQTDDTGAKKVLVQWDAEMEEDVVGKIKTALFQTKAKEFFQDTGKVYQDRDREPTAEKGPSVVVGGYAGMGQGFSMTRGFRTIYAELPQTVRAIMQASGRQVRLVDSQKNPVCLGYFLLNENFPPEEKAWKKMMEGLEMAEAAFGQEHKGGRPEW